MQQHDALDRKEQAYPANGIPARMHCRDRLESLTSYKLPLRPVAASKNNCDNADSHICGTSDLTSSGWTYLLDQNNYYGNSRWQP
jgi:hypothetical protein